MIELRVVNRDHDGGTLSIMRDLPELSYAFVLNDMGDASWTVPLSHDTLTRDGFAPKRTDYSIGISNDGGVSWQEVMDGICGPVGLKFGDQSVKVTANDYLVYLKQPYPFDYDIDPKTQAASDLVKFWIGESQSTIINAILSGVDLPFSVTGGGTLGEIVTKYVIMYGDTTELLSHLTTIGGMSAPKGFQFTLFPNYDIHIIAPTITAADATPIENFAPSFSTGLIDIDWSNKGPLATKTVGVYSGQPQAYSTFGDSVDTYRSWLEMVEIGDNFFDPFGFSADAGADLTRDIAAATASYGFLHRNPQKEITIKIKADIGDPDETKWFFNQCGETVTVNSEEYFLPYHIIDATYVITRQELTHVGAGEYECSLSLDQVF